MKNNRLSFSFLILAVTVFAIHQSGISTHAADADAGSEAHAEDGHGHDGHDDEHAADSHGDDGHGDSHGGGHGHGHGHDESNLVHGNASTGLKDILEFKPDLAVFSLLVFTLLVLALWKFAFGPIISGLNAREQNIQSQIATAKEAAGKAEAMLADYEAKLANAANEANEIVAEGRRDAETTRDRIVAEAEEAAQREKERAINEIEIAKNAALQAVAEQATDMAVGLAGDIIGSELDRDDHEQLIQQALSNLDG